MKALRRHLRTVWKRVPISARLWLLTLLYGLAGGAVAVAFLTATNGLYARLFPPLAARGLPLFAAGSLAVVVLSTLAVGFLLHRFRQDAAGSGIPQLKQAYWRDWGALTWRGAWVKLVAGVLSLAGGSSLGREGPTVYASGAAASALAGQLGIPKRHRRTAAAAGAAAGLAAAFNTPIAAVTFVLEELIADLNSRFLGPALFAAVTGAFVAFAVVGRQPAFAMPEIRAISWRAYLLVPIVAAVASRVGLLFQRATLELRQQVRSQSRLPIWLRPVIGGLITWALGVGVFAAIGKLGVFSLGYDDLSEALSTGLAGTSAALLLLAKLPATVCSYGWGGCGGIFSPTLFLGAMSGFVISGLAGLGLPLSSCDQLLLAAVGMSACFGAVVRAPLTALLMIFEMTHQFELVPALMVGTLISQALARRTGSTNFYEAILQQDAAPQKRVDRGAAFPVG